MIVFHGDYHICARKGGTDAFVADIFDADGKRFYGAHGFSEYAVLAMSRRLIDEAVSHVLLRGRDAV